MAGIGLSVVRVLQVIVLIVVAIPVLAILSAVIVHLGVPLPLHAHPRMGGPGDSAALMVLHAVVGLAMLVSIIGILYLLRLLAAVLHSVRQGMPFTDGNAVRLKKMAWTLTVMQVAHITIFAVEFWMAPTTDQVYLHLPLSGVVAIVLLFVLAWVFRVGAEMRDELDQVI